jgi:branched-chain amino acid transport system ATP-binding protein
MSGADEILRLEGVTRRFGGLVALNDVSFSVHAGEVVGLIGPNGAGKSTLFEVTSGTMPPSAGRIHLFGRDVTSQPTHLRRRAGLGRTFQTVRLFETLTAAENVAIAAMQCVRDGDWRAEARRALASLDLLALADRYPGEMTLADRKRIEIARAIVGPARLLMLDEALSGLTPAEAEAIMGEILALNSRDGVTVIVVEHVMPIVVRLARRLVVLNFGSVIADGTPAEVAADEQVVTAYLGSSRKAFA